MGAEFLYRITNISFSFMLVINDFKGQWLYKALVWRLKGKKDRKSLQENKNILSFRDGSTLTFITLSSQNTWTNIAPLRCELPDICPRHYDTLELHEHHDNNITLSTCTFSFLNTPKDICLWLLCAQLLSGETVEGLLYVYVDESLAKLEFVNLLKLLLACRFMGLF